MTNWGNIIRPFSYHAANTSTVGTVNTIRKWQKVVKGMSSCPAEETATEGALSPWVYTNTRDTQDLEENRLYRIVITVPYFFFNLSYPWAQSHLWMMKVEKANRECPAAECCRPARRLYRAPRAARRAHQRGHGSRRTLVLPQPCSSRSCEPERAIKVQLC